MDNNNTNTQRKNYNENGLRILQWNCHSILNKLDELKIISDNYDIMIIIETWLKNHNKIYIPNFNIVRKDRIYNKNHPNEHGGKYMHFCEKEYPLLRMSQYIP